MTSSGSVEAPASQTNHSHRINVGVGVALVDVVVVGVGPIVVDVVVVIVIVGVGSHDRSDVEGTACVKGNEALGWLGLATLCIYCFEFIEF